PYDAMNGVMKIMKDHDLSQWNQDFQLDCKLEFSVRKSEADVVAEALQKITGTSMKWLRTE
ncbi:MAG TPA: YigZ family protein, partial [Bacteroidia bacterium]|nr:YigZ family protein [Bacteroidia bacterium]